MYYEKKFLSEMTEIEIYELVLEGEHIVRFPKGYWQRPDALNNAKLITQYLIEERLKWSYNDIINNLKVETFKKYKLRGMLSKCFNDSPYEAINFAYPNEFKPWEFNCVYQGYWKNEVNRKLAIKWLIEEKLKLSDEELKEQLSFRLFKDNGFGSVLNNFFNNNPYKAINFAYPNKFKKSDFYVYKHLK